MSGLTCPMCSRVGLHTCPGGSYGAPLGFGPGRTRLEPGAFRMTTVRVSPGDVDPYPEMLPAGCREEDAPGAVSQRYAQLAGLTAPKTTRVVVMVAVEVGLDHPSPKRGLPATMAVATSSAVARVRDVLDRQDRMRVRSCAPASVAVHWERPE